MNFRDLCTAQLNFPEADFWVVTRGTDLGQPVKTFAAEHIGIKITRTDKLVPSYVYYLFEYQKMRGIYAGERQLQPGFFDRIEFVPTESKKS